MKFFLLSLSLFCLLVTQVFPQKFYSYNKDGLKFNFPTDWTINDQSDDKIQTLFLSKPGSTILITISSPREKVTTRDQYRNFWDNSMEKYEKAVVRSLQTADKKPKEHGQCFDLNNRQIGGTKYMGFYKNQAATGEVYPFVLGDRFITLVYMRIDKEEAVGTPVWNSFLKSLNLSDSNRDAYPLFIKDGPGEGGILNGKAVKLVRPTASKLEFQAGNAGDVEVRVEIDEAGNVVSAKAVSGPRMMYERSEYAARKSKFSPTTICGHPARVTGTIVYIFDPRDR